MGQIADALKKLQENSDDLSNLPQLVAQVETIESNEQMYQERINTLQQINQNYLRQIPVPKDNPHEQEEQEEEEPTLEDAQQHIIETLGGK